MQELSIKSEQIQEIPLSEINLNRETQIRVSVSEETVRRYFEVMVDEATRDLFPPILLYRDPEGRLWLADGHHRVLAAIRRGFSAIRAIIRSGMKADAIWEAAKVNGRNGLPLGKSDLRRAVEMILATSPDHSNRAIADNIGCSESYVRKIYDQLRTGAQLPEKTSVIGKDGKRRAAPRKKPHDQPSSTTAQSTTHTVSTVSEVEAAPEETACIDNRNRIVAMAEQEAIEGLLAELKSLIDEWYEIAPADMHIPFTRRLCGRIIKLNAEYERLRYESLLKVANKDR